MKLKINVLIVGLLTLFMSGCSSLKESLVGIDNNTNEISENGVDQLYVNENVEEDIKDIVTREEVEKYKGRVSAGGYYVAGLKDDGKLQIQYLFEDKEQNNEKKIDLNNIGKLKYAITSTYYVGCINEEGKVDILGGHTECNLDNWSNISQLAVIGYQQVVGLKDDGTIAVEIANMDPRFLPYRFLEALEWTDIIQVSGEGRTLVGLKKDGSVVAVGQDENGVCDVEDWNDIIEVDASTSHTVGLKSDGTVIAVGNNEDGECNVANWKDIVSISAGWGYTLGLKSNGTVVATGYNYPGIGGIPLGCIRSGRCDVGELNDIVGIDAGEGCTVALRRDGTVIMINEDGSNEIFKLW